MSMDCSDSFECTPEMEDFLCERLLDQSQSIAERFRALFSLRNLKGDRPREALVRATRDPSNLLAHEAAFALGQMQDIDAVPALEEVLKDLSLHPIVRHEAAEALGAIGSEGVVPLLKDTLIEDPILEVQETCELALRRIMEQKNSNNGDGTTTKASPFHTVDPAMPASLDCSVDQLREALLNEEEGIYERYAALFALRNLGDEAAVRVIIESLGARSALLRHEVAYVLGQLQHKIAASALADILRNINEHPMVRHEAAEALGSIADSESIQLLQEFTSDPEPIVSQSCEVALSMLEFERAGKSFEISSSGCSIMSSCVKPIQPNVMEPVVLLHGFDSSCLEWRYAYPFLEDAGLETWAVDILGWGFSDLKMLPSTGVAAKREHLYELWRTHIERPMVLVGPSLGASVAIDFAVNHPEAVTRLVLIDASVYAEGTGNLSKLPRAVAYAAIGRLHCLLPWWEDATIDFMLSGGYNVRPQIKQVKQKTLILWGENDRIINVELAQRLHDELPNSIFHQIPDCGHLPHVEKPDIVAESILKFVRGTTVEKPVISAIEEAIPHS